MGDISDPRPCTLLLAAFSRQVAALDWTARRATEVWGPIVDTSDRFAFAQTDYYDAAMGPDLLKQFFVFERPFDPGDLPRIKHQTNAWEREYAAQAAGSYPRPLNLDPGYLTLAKLVLASTKDYAHRIYLADGIYAEITLSYRHKQWQTHPWTFPDYRQDHYHAFFDQVRARLAGRG